jgi:hypothetical protein
LKKSNVVKKVLASTLLAGTLSLSPAQAMQSQRLKHGMQNNTVRYDIKKKLLAIKQAKTLAKSVLLPFSKTKQFKKLLMGTALAGTMNTVPASAKTANKMFTADQRSYISETQQRKHDYHLSQQRTESLLAPTPVANQASASPINIKIEVHATPDMDEQILVDLMDRKLRDSLRQSDYRRRHQLFDGYKL